jgi:drug/metabolite transporter (DMT)-like permease
MSELTALLYTLCAHGSLGTGNVLMKMGIGWLSRSQGDPKRLRRDRFLWLSGFLILNSSGLFMALAVKGFSPQLVTAFAGFGILVMILLSRLLLKEPLFFSDLPGTALIVIALLFLGLGAKPDDAAIWIHPAPIGLAVMLLCPLLLFFTGLVSSRFSAHTHALCAGMSSGILVILLKLLVARYGYSVGGYLGSAYAYLYIFFALLALVSLQLALKKGALMLVGPLQYGSMILFPPLGAILVGAQFPLIQAPFLLLAVLGIWLIMRRR